MKMKMSMEALEQVMKFIKNLLKEEKNSGRKKKMRILMSKLANILKINTLRIQKKTKNLLIQMIPLK